MTLLKREEILKAAYKLGFDYEKKYGGCSQCVFAAIQELFDLEDCNSNVLKASTSLAGGVGDSGEGTCGALTGGCMAISLKYGRGMSDLKISSISEVDPESSARKALELSKKLVDRFTEEFGGLTCRGIQKKIFGRSFNFWDPKDVKEFEKAGGHLDKCPSVVGKASQWVAELLLDEAGK